ncbi:hypothetical protein AGMMS50262_01390 [Bacteroidia bacterium]|nr:hypothetical protein AGMMS50262_01390 [Bacteroidia bacterium]
MTFYRRGRNDNNREQQFSEKKKAKFQVSDKSFRKATLVSSLTITVFVFTLFIIKAAFAISESDIQTICEITAGLSAFALAIPLFLKDFDITSNFWKQFYLIAITFLIATFIGVVTFLQTSEDESKNIMLYLWFFFSILISVNVNNLTHLGNQLKLKISLNPILNLSISYLCLLISLIFSKGNFLVYGTILFTIYGFYLILTLMMSVLFELLFSKPTKDNDLRIKRAIQHLVEKYKEMAFDEQTLLDKLKSESFPNEQEIISRTKIQDLVAEMDIATAADEPKITIYEYDKIIPRWRKEYDEILSPEFIFLTIDKSDIEENIYAMNNKFYKSHIEEIFEILSNKTELSKEILKENNVLERNYYIKYGVIDCITYDYSSFYYTSGKYFKNDKGLDLFYLSAKGYHCPIIMEESGFLKYLKNKEICTAIDSNNKPLYYRNIEYLVANNDISIIWEKEFKME